MRIPRRVALLLACACGVALLLLMSAKEATKDTILVPPVRKAEWKAKYGAARRQHQLQSPAPEPAPAPARAARVPVVTTLLGSPTKLPTEVTAAEMCRIEHAAPRAVGTRMREAVQTFPMQGWMSWAE